MSKPVDYSFMKTGYNNVVEAKPNEKIMEDLHVMLALFISNATTNGARYAELSQRNGVTKEDIQYGLRYEVFEFLNRDNIMNELENIRQEINSEIIDDYGIGWAPGWEWYDQNLDDVSETGWYWEGDGLPPAKPSGPPPQEYFEDDDVIVDDEDIDDFKEVNSENVDEKDKEFVKKMNSYFSTWDEWVPQNKLEELLKNAIDKT